MTRTSADRATSSFERAALLTRDLTASGLTHREISADVNAERRLRLHRGVLTPGPAPATPVAAARARATGALLLMPDAVVSHLTAAAIHDLPVPSGEQAVCVTRASQLGCRRRPQPSRVHLHTAGLGADDIVINDGLAVTSLARTVCDVARTFGLGEALAVADAALRSGTVARSDLATMLATQARWPGVARAGRVCRIADAGAESPLESRIRAALVLLAGLPVPELQRAVRGGSGRGYRPDLCWPADWTIVEVDGRIKYDDARSGSARTAVWEEKRRADDLVEAGWELVRIAAEDLRLEPAVLGGRVAAAFSRARLRHGSATR